MEQKEEICNKGDSKSKKGPCRGKNWTDRMSDMKGEVVPMTSRRKSKMRKRIEQKKGAIKE